MNDYSTLITTIESERYGVNMRRRIIDGFNYTESDFDEISDNFSDYNLNGFVQLKKTSLHAIQSGLTNRVAFDEISTNNSELLTINSAMNQFSFNKSGFYLFNITGTLLHESPYNDNSHRIIIGISKGGTMTTSASASNNIHRFEIVPTYSDLKGRVTFNTGFVAYKSSVSPGNICLATIFDNIIDDAVSISYMYLSNIILNIICFRKN